MMQLGDIWGMIDWLALISVKIKGGEWKYDKDQTNKSQKRRLSSIWSSLWSWLKAAN